jgi:hypothetical protein
VSKFTSTQIKRFKLDAKTQARESGIPLHQALDNVAHAMGYSNWALLMKNAGPEGSTARMPFLFARSGDEMRAAMRNPPETFERVPGRNAKPNVNVPDIWREFASAKNAVDFAIAYMSTILKTPRYQVGLRSQAYWEMRLWLPYVLETVTPAGQVLVNREYKPVGLDSTEHVDYRKFATLQTNLSAEQIQVFSHAETGQGYLYGLSPWGSRKAAETYLKRLQMLQTALN